LARSQTIGYRNQTFPIAHVATVHLAAIVFDGVNEPFQLPPDCEIRRKQRGLRVTARCNQNLVIVQPTEEILRGLERGDVSGQPWAPRVQRQFRRVSQFLEGDAHVVQPFRHIERSRHLNRPLDPGRPTREPRIQRPEPDPLRANPIVGTSFCVRRLIGAHGSLEPVHQPFEFPGGQFGGKPFACGISRVTDSLAQQSERRQRIPTVPAEIVNQTDQHVQLAHDTQLLGHPSQLTIEFPTGRSIQLKKREKLAKSPRGDAHAVQRIDTAPFDVTEFARERSEPLPKQIDRLVSAAQEERSL